MRSEYLSPGRWCPDRAGLSLSLLENEAPWNGMAYGKLQCRLEDAPVCIDERPWSPRPLRAARPERSLLVQSVAALSLSARLPAAGRG